MVVAEHARHMAIPSKDFYVQALRGIAISAVVLIHCLPGGGESIALRPFLNWSVAMFLFLSGMLTTETKVTRDGVLKRRLVKIALPYLVWSAVYLVLSCPDSVFDIAWRLLTGGASVQMYYLLVYAQLTLLTPWLFKLLRTHRVLLYAVTPMMLVVWALFALFEIDVPRLGRLFPMWLIYYLVGLEWERWRDFLNGKVSIVAVVAVLSLLAQVAEGFLWNAFGDYNMATTQLRVTNMASSLAIVSLFMIASSSLRLHLSECDLLVRLGDFSFGIYLCHMVFVKALVKSFLIVGITGLFPSLVLWIIALTLSAMAVALCQRIFPKHLLSVLGFV